MLEAAQLPGTKHIETYNMALNGREVLSAALGRKHSVGAHFRDDE